MIQFDIKPPELLFVLASTDCFCSLFSVISMQFCVCFIDADLDAVK